MLEASALSVERLMAPCRRSREGELAAGRAPGTLLRKQMVRTEVS